MKKSNLKKFYDIHEVQKQWVFIYNKVAELLQRLKIQYKQLNMIVFLIGLK